MGGRTHARRLDVWLGASCVLVIAFSALQIALFSFGRDQSIYAVVADGILDGELPYRDRWDFKPPGIFLLYAGAQAVFGRTMLAPRLLEIICLIASCGLMVSLGRRLFADSRSGLIAGGIAAWVHAQMEFWHSGQPESFGGALTIAGLWLATSDSENRRARWAAWLTCGACFGVAFLLKPPLGGGALVCTIYLMRRASFRGVGPLVSLVPALAVGFGVLVPIAACALWFWAAGGWEALRWTLFEFTPGYTKLGWAGGNAAGAFYYAIQMAFTRFSAVLAIGAVAAGIGAPVSSREREGLALILGVLALHLAGIGMQAKFFEYHFGASLPLVALLAGLGWLKVWRAAVRRGPGGAVAFASLIVVAAMARRAVLDVPEGYWVRSAERVKFALGLSEHETREELDRRFYYVADFNLAADRDVAKRITELTEPGTTIFVWGFEPAIYWFADRPPASRFIYNVAQRAQWGRDRARADLLSDLERNPPELFVVQHHDYFKFVTGDDLDSAQAVATFPELEALLQRDFEKLEQIEDFEIYRRRGQPTALRAISTTVLRPD